MAPTVSTFLAAARMTSYALKQRASQDLPCDREIVYKLLTCPNQLFTCHTRT